MVLYLAIAIGACSSFVMILFSQKYYARKNFFDSFLSFLEEISLNLSFLKNDLPKLLSEFRSNSQNFKDILDAYILYLSTNDEEAFKSSIYAQGGLKQEEQIKIIDYFLRLGRTDCKTQEELTKTLITYVLEKLNVCKKDIASKCTLIQKLGIVFGIVVVILLI